VNRSDRPLGDLRFVLVGPGRVGSSLAAWAVARGAACAAVAGRAGSERTRAVADRLGARSALAADLEPVTFHPLRVVPRIEPDPEAAAGTFFALDGAPEARALGRRLAEAFGGTAAVVPEEVRALYHLAATLAAGGIATTFASAIAVARAAGVPAAALAGYGALARGALSAALEAAEPADAITGPAARGDLETVELQLARLEATAPELRPLVVALARAALDRRRERAPWTPSQRALAERLSRSDLLDRSRDRVLTSKPST
jgi:predicted short-subunit dehydrogenase-like oxidoreductase (DUF2520 family)